VSRLIDVSLPIGADLLVWPGDPPVEVVPRLRIASGAPANVSELRMGTHTGTHVDPPNHFVEGTNGIDAVPSMSCSDRRKWPTRGTSTEP
jgi:arylformamidase